MGQRGPAPAALTELDTPGRGLPLGEGPSHRPSETWPWAKKTIRDPTRDDGDEGGAWNMRGQQERTERGRGRDEGPPLPVAGTLHGWRKEEGEA